MTSSTLRTQKEYARRINAALDWLDRNLGGEITVSKLAQAAHFSPFHFHRIFSAFVGEPPAEYVRRLRLEKAALILIHDALASVTDVALACGFSTSSLFSRLFRARFGMSPTAWRAGGSAAPPARDAGIGRKKSKKRQAARKNGKDGTRGIGYKISAGSKPGERRSAMRKTPAVRIEDVPPLRVAYVKHMRGYGDGAGIERAFQTLFCWAGPRGVLSPDMRVLGMSLDNPEITPKDKCRYYACVAVTGRAEPDGEVGIMDVRPGKYAVARFKGGPGVFKGAYDFMYGDWLPRSGWQPDDAPAFESYADEPEIGAKNKAFSFDLYIPVKTL